MLSAEAREIFEEGLRIPITKLFQRGEPNAELIKLIRANVRTPEETVGDLYAQTSSNAVGARSLLHLMSEFSLDSIDRWQMRSSRARSGPCATAIAKLPNGRYENETWSDGFEEPVRIRVAVTVRRRDI